MDHYHSLINTRALILVSSNECPFLVIMIMMMKLVENKMSVLCNKNIYSMKNELSVKEKNPKNLHWIILSFSWSFIITCHWIWPTEMYEHIWVFVHTERMECACKEQCPPANFGLHFNSTISIQSKSWKMHLIYRKQLFLNTWNKYILIYITVKSSCAIRHTLISYILMISQTHRSHICTEILCTSLKNLLQCLLKKCTFDSLLFEYTRTVKRWSTKDDHEGTVGTQASKQNSKDP